MKRLVILFCLALLFLPNIAQACRYEARPFEQLLQSANIIFIGKVSAVENGKVTFSVDAAIRGARDGATFSSEIGQSSCDIRFQTGETWLYMGSIAPSGSLLLISDTGQVQTDNAKLVKEKTGFDVTADAATFNGSLRSGCAPWDGPAFGIHLQNGLNAQVWSRIPEVGFFSKNYAASMTASKEGEGSIIYCPSVPPSAEPACQRLEGDITLTEIKDGTASGYITAKEGPFAGQNPFHVRILASYELCG